MAQTVFRPAEVNNTKGEVVLQFTKNFTPPVEEKVEEVPKYTGPTADDCARKLRLLNFSGKMKKPRCLQRHRQMRTRL